MITIVSLAWNKLEMTRDFLTNLKKHTDIPHKLVFTDNGSSEPIVNVIKEIYPEATLIVKDHNVGCPRTRNEAMKHVNTDICFWLDNDAMVGPGWYEPVLKALDDETVGISGPQGYIVKKPWSLPYPFEPALEGDCDYFMGWLVGFKTKAYKPINDYNTPVNLDDVELAFGVKATGLRAKISGACFARHLVSQTGRGWETDNQEKLKAMWANWPDKSIFERWK